MPGTVNRRESIHVLRLRNQGNTIFRQSSAVCLYE